MKIKEILQQEIGTKISVKGWVRFNRPSKKLGFMELYDGTTLNGIQLVYKADGLDYDTFETLSSLALFSAVHIEGQIAQNQRNQTLEIIVQTVVAIAPADETNPLQKKTHSLEFLREIAHLRPRTKTFQAIFKLRSLIFQLTHEFFTKEGFIFLTSPIITSNDAEGAGESFRVTTNDLKDFFNQPSNLSVSGQLHAEAYAQAFSKVYTLAPTFRAENSNTQRHAAEFWMLEPEVAFASYFEVMDLGAKLLGYIAHQLRILAPQEIAFLSEINEVDLDKRFQLLIDQNIKKITYREALTILEDNKEQFEEQNIVFGLDLATEHEKFLANYFENHLVYIYDYPQKIKAFYMKQNDDQTVRGFDLIVPDIGELIGGSQREESLDKLLANIEQKGVDATDLTWYLELRKQGYLESTGFGLGMERLVMFLSGTKNIRDVLPFPRTPGDINY